MIIAHGFQYLLLVGLVAAGGRTGKPRMLQIALLLNVALLGGLTQRIPFLLGRSGK
jgi:DNA-binding PadR family transcriptional regulator